VSAAPLSAVVGLANSMARLLDYRRLAQNESVWTQHQPLAALVPDSIKKRQGPEALIEAFRERCRPPDGLGEIHNLTRAEARALRACGYNARSGCYGRVWRCPTLPDHLVFGTEFDHLSDAYSRAYGSRPGEWHPKRAQFRPFYPMDPLSKHQHQLLGMIRNADSRRLTRRQLQTRVSRWANARYLDHMLNGLTALNCVTNDDEGWIYPYSRAEFESIERRASESRLAPTYQTNADGSRTYAQTDSEASHSCKEATVVGGLYAVRSVDSGSCARSPSPVDLEAGGKSQTTNTHASKTVSTVAKVNGGRARSVPIPRIFTHIAQRLPGGLETLIVLAWLSGDESLRAIARRWMSLPGAIRPKVELEEALPRDRPERSARRRQACFDCIRAGNRCLAVHRQLAIVSGLSSNGIDHAGHGARGFQCYGLLSPNERTPAPSSA
jgi:hypothetical protein